MNTNAIVDTIKDMNGLETIGVLVLILFLSKGKAIFNFVKKKLDKEEKKAGHESCANFNDLRYVIDKSIERAIRIFDIKKYETLGLQMDIVERTTGRIESIMKQNFAKLLGDHQDRHSEIRRFDKIWYYVSKHIHDQIKDWIRANHLLERTPKEWHEYCLETTQDIISSTSAALDDAYFDADFCIPREKLKDYNYRVSGERIEKLLDDMLQDIRQVSYAKRKEIDILEEENYFKE